MAQMHRTSLSIGRTTFFYKCNSKIILLLFLLENRPSENAMWLSRFERVNRAKKLIWPENKFIFILI